MKNPIKPFKTKQKKGENFMCKTYDAIYKLVKKTESNVIILWVGSKKISGELYMCDDGKCYDEVVTIKDAIVEDCRHKDCEYKEYKWLNIPSHSISAFTFKCCVK